LSYTWAVASSLWNLLAKILAGSWLPRFVYLRRYVCMRQWDWRHGPLAERVAMAIVVRFPSIITGKRRRIPGMERHARTT
jgi:hypothetical protein